MCPLKDGSTGELDQAGARGQNSASHLRAKWCAPRLESLESPSVRQTQRRDASVLAHYCQQFAVGAELWSCGVHGRPKHPWRFLGRKNVPRLVAGATISAFAPVGPRSYHRSVSRSCNRHTRRLEASRHRRNALTGGDLGAHQFTLRRGQNRLAAQLLPRRLGAGQA